MIDRREFLRTLAQGSLSFGILGCASLERPPIARGSKAPVTAGPKGLVFFCVAKNDDVSTLHVLDWDARESFEIPIPLGYPHSLVQDPENPTTLFSFEAFGSLAKFDSTKGVVAKIDHLNGTSMFDGHGVLTKTRDRLVCTEFDKDSATIVTVRHATTLERIAVLPSECYPSHQIVSLPGTTIVACANLQNSRPGFMGGITFFDYEKNAVVKKVDFEHPVIHLTALSSTEAIGVSRPSVFGAGAQPVQISHSKKSIENLMSIRADERPAFGPICRAGLDGRTTIYFDEIQKTLLNGSFGIATVPGTDSFLSSHLNANTVLLWKEGKIAHVFDAPGAMNLIVSQDGSEFMVLSQSKLLVFSLRSFERLRTISYSRPILLMGSVKGGYA